jgi:phytoene dehydrogenase-like protein
MAEKFMENRISETRDVIIVGGGHNGLVAAFYLAKTGF